MKKFILLNTDDNKGNHLIIINQIKKDILQKILSFLNYTIDKQIIFETLCILINLSYDIKGAKLIGDKNNDYYLLTIKNSLMFSLNDKIILYYTLWLIKNLCHEITEIKLFFYNNCIFDYFLKIIEKYEFDDEINKMLITVITNISKTNIFSNVDKEYIKVIPFLVKNLTFIGNANDIQKPFYILFKMSETRNLKVLDSLLSCGIHKKIIKMYKEIKTNNLQEDIIIKIKLFILMILGNIASGDNIQTQTLINNGIIDFVNELLKEYNLKILKNVFWIVESICSGSLGQISCLFEKNTIYFIIQIGILLYENIGNQNNDNIKSILLIQNYKTIIRIICLCITGSLNQEVISILSYENHISLSFLIYALKNFQDDYKLIYLIFKTFHTIKLIEEILPDSSYYPNDYSYFSFMIDNGLENILEKLSNCENVNISKEAEYFYDTLILGDDDPENVLRNSNSIDIDDIK